MRHTVEERLRARPRGASDTAEVKPPPGIIWPVCSQCYVPSASLRLQGTSLVSYVLSVQAQGALTRFLTRCSASLWCRWKCSTKLSALHSVCTSTSIYPCLESHSGTAPDDRIVASPLFRLVSGSWVTDRSTNPARTGASRCTQLREICQVSKQS